MFAQVSFPIPYEDFFTYSVPRGLQGVIAPGVIVNAPLGHKPAVGVVAAVTENPDLPASAIKEVDSLGDPELSIPPDLLSLAELTALKYGTTPGMVFKGILPPGTLQRKNLFFYPGSRLPDRGTPANVAEFLAAVKQRPGGISYRDLHGFRGIGKKDVDDLAGEGSLTLSPFKQKSPRGEGERWLKAAMESIPEGIKIGPKGRHLFETLLKSSGEIRAASLSGLGFSANSAAALVKKGLATIEHRDKGLDIGKLGFLAGEEVFELTLWQQSVLKRVEETLAARAFAGILLYGVTSSGKTQVYIEAAERALRAGRSVLVLAPEISLTPQLVSRFEKALRVTPLVWHSQLTAAEKAIVYKKARSGQAKLLIGARSAVFAPLTELGLIVVDEEQDSSYKQDDPAPRYSARDLALERGRISGSTVILGSATPSSETYHAALAGRIELHTLPQRVTGQGLPEIRIISTAWKPGDKSGSMFPGGFWPVSAPMHAEISVRLKKKEQIIILLNRRGYSSSVVCFECGWLGRCPDCEIGWTYHKGRGMMVCHFCGKEQPGPTVCPSCRSARLSFRGAGTEKLEETLKSLFPRASITRLDSDVVGKRFKSRDILDDFGAGKIDILMGTQMVAKGHHFPAVGFVGVIGADVGLSLPDFRASERVLQLLIQAAGRAGRSVKKKERGTVMIQTFSPQNRIFDCLLKDDYTGFMEEELEIRRALNYPPFSRLISIIISSKDQGRAARLSKRLKDELRGIPDADYTDILGPARASIFKRGKNYRFQILLKLPTGRDYHGIVRRANLLARESKGASILLDVDPMNFS